MLKLFNKSLSLNKTSLIIIQNRFVSRRGQQKENSVPSKQVNNVISIQTISGASVKRRNFRFEGLSQRQKEYEDEIKEIKYRGFGKSDNLEYKLIEENEKVKIKYDPDKDLDMFSRNENDFYENIINEDIKERKRIKNKIIFKKINKLEGNLHKNFNLLTWEAKEQIKHLNLNNPG
jgi:hypothetical protein